MIPDLPADIDQIKGFLTESEGEALYRQALAVCAFCVRHAGEVAV